MLLFGTWLITECGFFSVASFFHSYYMVTMAPAAAAMVGIGVTALWREYRNSSLKDWRFWLLPAALVATAAGQAHILQDYPDWSRWMTPLAVAGSVAAALILIVVRVARLRRVATLCLPIAAAAGVLSLLVAPTTWAAQTVSNSNGGGVPSAGPAAGGRGGFGGFGGFGGRAPARFAEFAQAFARRGGAGAPGDAGGVNTALLSYLEQHQGNNHLSVCHHQLQLGGPVHYQDRQAGDVPWRLFRDRIRSSRLPGSRP